MVVFINKCTTAIDASAGVHIGFVPGFVPFRFRFYIPAFIICLIESIYTQKLKFVSTSIKVVLSLYLLHCHAGSLQLNRTPKTMHLEYRFKWMSIPELLCKDLNNKSLRHMWEVQRTFGQKVSHDEKVAWAKGKRGYLPQVSKGSDVD